MIFKIIRSFKKGGFVETVRLIIHRTIDQYEVYQNRKFDVKYGVETSLHEWDLIIQSEEGNKDYSYNYEPASVKLFHQSIRKIDVDLSQFVFLDLGSGKGKALMMASEYPFKKIIGIEFISKIHTIAKNNIEHFINKKGIGNFQLLHKDASLYNFPSDNIILFLYNPFDGKVLDSVIQKIEKHITQTSKEIYIVYQYPVHSESFENSDLLELLYETNRYKIYFQNKKIKK